MSKVLAKPAAILASPITALSGLAGMKVADKVGLGGVTNALTGQANQIPGFQVGASAAQGEQNAIDFYNQQLSGQGPSIGQMSYQKALEDAARQQQAFAASARGGQNAALAARTAQQQIGEAQAGAGLQSAMMQAQERQQAAGGLGNIAAAQRGVAANVAGQNLQAQTAAQGQQLGLLGNIGGGLIAASDEKLKDNIKETKKANSSIEEFLDAVKSVSFNYKGDDKNRDGVIAQDLEKTKLGNQMVKDTPQGKMVDFGQGFANLLAAQAELNERLKKIEGKNAKTRQ
jgi:hypothetical protein